MLQHMLESVPSGVDLEEANALVRDDLAPDEALKDLLGEDSDEELDFFELRGQLPRIRPILVALAARAAGARGVDHDLQYAAELLHMGLFLHDVALGREGGRRRWVARKFIKRSVRWVSGATLSIRAMELSRHSHPKMLGEVLDTLREFADGQALCDEIKAGLVPSQDDWREHADAHVGALFAFCCRGGAYLAGAETGVRVSLGRFGRHLGRLWHIAEDVSMLQYGKGGTHLMTRALSGRPVFPLVIALEQQPALVNDWRRFNAEPSIEAGERLARLIIDTAALGLAREAMAKESWAARQALRDLPESRYRRGMDGLARNLARAGTQLSAKQSG
jgi:geranylgeranyl pyrophosphate synthase